MISNKVIQSYVFSGDQCFFVSTIERDSSAMLAPGRYNETLVWEYFPDKRERGKLLYEGEDLSGYIDTHQDYCKKLFKYCEIKELGNNGEEIIDGPEDDPRKER